MAITICTAACLLKYHVKPTDKDPKGEFFNRPQLYTTISLFAVEIIGTLALLILSIHSLSSSADLFSPTLSKVVLGGAIINTTFITLMILFDCDED